MIWLLLIICLLLCFVLSGTESALLTVNRVRVRHAAEEGNKKAADLVLLLERRDELLQTVAAANHVCGIIAFSLAAISIVHHIGPWGWAITVLLSLPVFLIGLELVPKKLFRYYPFRSLLITLSVLKALHVLGKPWLALSRKLKPRALELLPLEADHEGLDSLAKSISGLKILPDASMHMLDKFTAFQKYSVEEAMMPLRNLTALPPDIPLSNLAGLSKELQHPWRAVLGDNGNLLGWLDITTLPARLPHDRLVRQYVRPITSIKSTEAALRCLQILRKRGEPLAVVIDDKQQTAGVVTEQALISKLLGIPSNGK